MSFNILYTDPYELGLCPAVPGAVGTLPFKPAMNRSISAPGISVAIT